MAKIHLRERLLSFQQILSFDLLWGYLETKSPGSGVCPSDIRGIISGDLFFAVPGVCWTSADDNLTIFSVLADAARHWPLGFPCFLLCACAWGQDDNGRRQGFVAAIFSIHISILIIIFRHYDLENSPRRRKPPSGIYGTRVLGLDLNGGERELVQLVGGNRFSEPHRWAIIGARPGFEVRYIYRCMSSGWFQTGNSSTDLWEGIYLSVHLLPLFSPSKQREKRVVKWETLVTPLWYIHTF